MKVVEKFISINGEATRAGELSVFIRFQGCNLSCNYCDTMWANEKDCKYEDLSPEQITEYIKDIDIKNVTLTGGEPLMQPQIKELLKLLSNEKNISVEVETNGSINLEPFCNEYRPIFTMDYKLPSSGQEKNMYTNNFSMLSQKDVVKFVCGSTQDVMRAFEITKEYQLTKKCNVYLSPVFGRINPSEIVELMIKNKQNNIRLQIQMHKIIWNPEQRGV